MPILFNASVRKTYTYNDAHRHLDEWAETYQFKALSRKITEVPDGYDSGGAFVMRVIGDKKHSQSRQANALRYYFGGSSCTHEHDCCGCPLHYAHVTRVKRGVFSVYIAITYNI